MIIVPAIVCIEGVFSLPIHWLLIKGHVLLFDTHVYTQDQIFIPKINNFREFVVGGIASTIAGCLIRHPQENMKPKCTLLKETSCSEQDSDLGSLALSRYRDPYVSPYTFKRISLV